VASRFVREGEKYGIDLLKRRLLQGESLLAYTLTISKGANERVAAGLRDQRSFGVGVSGLPTRRSRGS
jgi:hypothetical protein